MKKKKLPKTFCFYCNEIISEGIPKVKDMIGHSCNRSDMKIRIDDLAKELEKKLDELDAIKNQCGIITGKDAERFWKNFNDKKITKKQKTYLDKCLKEYEKMEVSK